MNHFLFVFALVLSFLGLARATPAAHNQAAHHQLVARQREDPAVCTRANTAVNRCAATPATRITCMCRPALYNVVYNCLVARGKLNDQTDYSSGQQQLDELTITCDRQGVKMPIRTLPGQDPDRPVGTLNSSDDQTTTTRGPAVTPTQPAASATGDDDDEVEDETSTPNPAPTPTPTRATSQRVENIIATTDNNAAPTKGNAANVAPLEYNDGMDAALSMRASTLLAVASSAMAIVFLAL